MLNDFRNVDVIWDKATKNFVKKIRVASSDERGRKLTVQVVNGGQIQDLTNVALNLYWETQDGENRGLDPFTAVDPENGIYELYFRTGMLQHVGKLNAHLHLVDTTGAITSEPFTIFVFEGVDVDAMASDDELSALTQALVQVNNLETTYAPRLNSIESSVDSLDGRLTTVEQNIDFADISSGFSFASGVTSFYAYKFGRVVFLRFDYRPTETGFNYNVVTTTLYKPLLQVAVSVATRQSTVDSARGITSYFYGTGELRVVAPEVPGYPMLFTCMYFT